MDDDDMMRYRIRADTREALDTIAAMTNACRKCGGPMHPGHALAQTYTSGTPDDLGSDCTTMSPGGPGRLIDCTKCSACGWSVTGKGPSLD